MDEDALERFAADLSQHGYTSGRSVQIQSTIELPSVRPMTVLDTEAYSWAEDELLTAGTTGRGVTTRIPAGVRAAVATNLSWWTDVHRPSHQLPPRWPLNEHLVARSTSLRTRARVTTDGIASIRFRSDSSLAAPASHRRSTDPASDSPMSSRPPDPRQASWARRSRVGSGQVHTPLLGRVGTREALTQDLVDPTTRQVLNGWLSKAPSGKSPGNLIHGGRYLSLTDMQQLSGRNAQLQALDRWLQRGVTRRGLCLKCERCDHFGWYDAEDIGQDFRCARCRTTATITSHQLAGPHEEPSWYYALDEGVRQALEHHASVPLLTIAGEAAEGASSTLTMTDHIVEVGEDDSVEIDVWALIDGQVVLGEAKDSDDLGSSKRDRRRRRVDCAPLRTR